MTVYLIKILPNMLKPVFRNTLRHAVAFALLWLGGVQVAMCQSQAQVQGFLQAHPEVVEQLKGLLARRLQQEGSAIEEQAITDAMLAGRLQSDSGFRSAATRFLVEQRLLTEDQVKAFLGQAGETEEVAASAATPTRTAASGSPDRGAGGTKSIASTVGDQRTDDLVLTPRTVQRPNPYPDLPSARALYAQFPDNDKSLKRFGSDIFRPDVVGLSQYPMDLPAGPEYVLGPGDTVTLEMWGGVSQKLTRTVDREGRLSLPEAGPVVVAGLTLAQAQKLVQSRLEPQFRNANVDLSVTRVRTVRIYVVGDVQRPGAYDISALSTPLNALYAAGGPTATGSLRVVKHMRGSQLLGQMDLYDLLLRGVRQGLEHLQPGDTILVPPVGPIVAVSGMVRRPAIYELLGETQLADVLEMAGGVPVSASMDEIKVERIEAHTNRVMLKVKLPGGAGEQSLRAMVGTFWVKDGDQVTVASILPYSDKTIYLQGHVYRPGSYPFQDGMKITDLVHSYQDVLPEPANHAEIVRLEAPDFHPVTIQFDLATALAGTETVALQQFDTVRIYGRYDADAPKVAVYGSVLRPGEYPMFAGMSAAALVKMAGGFKRSAYLDSASLSSYVIENGQRVATDQQVLKIGAAVAGEAGADVKLKPGDVLTILQIPGWDEIGRSVSIRGEVTYPGSYGINEGERLSSLLKRVGGFRPSAYPAGAVLERIEVRELGQKGRQELIDRVENMNSTVQIAPNTSGKETAEINQVMQQQRQQILAQLRNQPVSGRLVITISEDISEWENTPADVTLRSGDVISIPRKPNFVMSFGQVYNPNAITYKPGKTAGWYLKQAGGPTELANKRGIYVVRANGSVVSPGGAGDWFSGGVLETKMQPGDVLVVPEKFVTGSSAWRTTLEASQFLASLALAGAAVASLAK